MSDPGSPSLTSYHVAADELPQKSPTIDRGQRHCQWPQEDLPATRFEPISLAEIEMQQHMESSHEMCTDDETSEKSQSEFGDDDMEEYADELATQHGASFSDSDADEPRVQQRPKEPQVRRRLTSLRPSTSKRARVAAEFVFGTDVTDDVQCDDHSDDADIFSVRSNTRAEEDMIFPTTSGCNLCNTIAKVDRFIDENLHRIEETNLFKLAGEVFKRLANETKREGNVAPVWPWREIRQHYVYHIVHHGLQRKMTLNRIQAIKMHLEKSMIRVTDIDGRVEKEVDGAKIDRYLKIVALESKERQLLNQPTVHR